MSRCLVGWFLILGVFGLVHADTLVIGWGNLIDLDIAPKGDLAAAASVSGSIVFLSPNDLGWRPVHLAPCGSSPISLVFSRAGTHLYAIHDDGVLRVWNPVGGASPRSIPVFTKDFAGPGGLALGADGELIAVGSLNQGVRVVHLGSGQVVYTTDRKVTGIALSFISRDELSIGTNDGQVYLWRFGESPQLLYSHRGFVNKLVYHETYIISVSDDKTAVVYDLHSRKIKANFRLPNFIRAMALHPSGWVLLGTYREALAWDFLNDRVVARIQLEGWVSGLACSPRTGKALVTSWEGEILEWDLESGQVYSVAKPELGKIVAVSPDGSRLVAIKTETLCLYRLLPFELLKETPLDSRIWAAVWLPGRNMFATLGSEGVRFWDADSLEPSDPIGILAKGYEIYSSPDGTFLAVEGWHRDWVCNVEERTCREFSPPEDGRLYRIAISPGGKKLAAFFTPENDQKRKILLVWDIASGEQTSYPAEGFYRVFFWDENLVLVGEEGVRIMTPTGQNVDIPLSVDWLSACFFRRDGVLGWGNHRGEVFVVDLKRPDSMYKVDLYAAEVQSLFICDQLLIFVADDGTLVIHKLPKPFVQKEVGP